MDKGSIADSKACQKVLEEHVAQIATVLRRIRAEKFANLREMEMETGVPRSTLSFLIRKHHKKTGLSGPTIIKLQRLLERVNAPSAAELVNELRALH